MNEWTGKKCKIFIRNLSERPIVYTGKILSIDTHFVTICDRYSGNVSVNVQDVIQIIQVREEMNDEEED